MRRPAPPRWTVRTANRHRYSPGPPEIPTRIRQEPSGDRSHPCAENPRGAAHRLPARYGSTTEQARLDRVSSPRTEALPAWPFQNRGDAQDTARHSTQDRASQTPTPHSPSHDAEPATASFRLESRRLSSPPVVSTDSPPVSIPASNESTAPVCLW